MSFPYAFTGANVKPTTLEKMFPEIFSFLEDPLKDFFGGDEPIQAFEVIREGGRARAARVIHGNNQSRTIDITFSNPQSGLAHLHFDRARYKIQRLNQLEKLGRYFPETSVLVTDGLWTQEGPIQIIIFLQQFLPYPVCNFTDFHSVLDLLSILFRSAELGILLDYNQNHWLYQKTENEKELKFYYVDKDYADDGRTFDNALGIGFDQCTLYLTLENSKHFARAFTTLSEKPRNYQAYKEIIYPRIQQSLKRLEERQRTKIVADRIESFNIILESVV